MSLNLQKPLTFLDLETTGTNTMKDRIVQIAMVKINPKGEEIKYNKLVNPEMPIPQESSDVHGITDDQVKDQPTFKEIAKEVNQFLKDCDFRGLQSY